MAINKNKYQKFNLGPNDRHVQIWRDFEVQNMSFSLRHLEAEKVVYKGAKKSYTVYVTYSHHCFAKDDSVAETDPDWIYPFPKDPRQFHVERWWLSLNLPEIIRNLMGAVTFHSGYGGYAVCSLIGANNKPVHYKVAFEAFRSEKKLRLHVRSAYPIEARPKVKKVRMELILDCLLGGRPLPKQQA